MLLVVADTGPLRYLVEIGEINILHRLFERVVIPEAVHKELTHRAAPEIVRQWAKEPQEIWKGVSRVVIATNRCRR